MTGFFKRMSRSRSNSQSYVDDYQTSPRHDSKLYEGDYPQKAPGSSHQSGGSSTQLKTGSLYSPHEPPSDFDTRMSNTNGFNPTAHTSALDHAPMAKGESAPDLLTRAFNEAIRPYTSKLDEMEMELADMRAYVERVQAQQREVFAWIDKRGMRPDVPPSIAALMDASTPNNPTHAAASLNAQLDRKIQIVNFDLHRLQDDMNESLPLPHFVTCMLKFVPDILRLNALQGGPRLAFDLILKLGGNLNSHGGVEMGDEDDQRERVAFYNKLDDAMVDIVQARFRDADDRWGVQREIKRIEKTAVYLRTWGVEPYFGRTLELMREHGERHMGSANAAPSPVGYD